MQIVIIAGGSGKRMQPLITHKTLFPFLGQPILVHTLNSVKIFTPTKIIVVTHPSVEAETTELAKNYSAEIVIQKESKGMHDAILTAKDHIDFNEPLFVIDAVTIQSQEVFIQYHSAIQANNDNCILLGGRKVAAYKPGGYFVFNNDNQVSKIVEKPGEDNMPSPFYKLVMDYYPFPQKLIESIQKSTSQNDDIYEVALSELIVSSPATMVEVTGDHASLKHAPRVLDVMDVFLKHYLVPGIDPSAKIAKNATINSDVQIGKNVRVFENAVIKGSTYIGDNTVIGNGALIRESCIEANCEIGYNTEVARSYIGPETKCHTSYIGDSLVEGKSNLAAGTITANLRFDGRNVLVNLPTGRIDSGRRKFGSILARGVKTGIHTSLMPGTVAESNSIIRTEAQYDNDKKE